jgi:hypothetical protein
MFWYGAPLSRVERLCMTSFVRNGHRVNLYTYDDVGPVPEGVEHMDAERVLPREYLYLHRRTQSVGLFADWFRYALLYEQGGIWVDTDVVCLKPFDYPEPEVFAWQDERYINNAVLGLPAGHEVAAWLAACCADPNRLLPYDSLKVRLKKWQRRYLRGNRRDRIGWGEYGPKGLTNAVRHFGYTDKVLPPSHFYPVPYLQWHVLFESSSSAVQAAIEGSRGVHLWNNMMRERPGFDKEGSFPPDSIFEQLCSRYL